MANLVKKNEIEGKYNISLDDSLLEEYLDNSNELTKLNIENA